ncbi:pentatricopeptide repeat-containing protein [Citrus sinensis]|uniref:Pentatricopeptide repeat-containing protein n=1 Tax=Citrus sinensis TaxID=2711 RepID=A0ACB8NLD0_CITSI|nr:pentatricopeptide repeat-containing protein [Citrus sinensis]
MKHIKYLSQWKKATAVGSPKLSARLICGLVNALIEAGLEPDSLSYNILISACIKTKKLDVTMPFNEQLKDNGQKCSSGGFHPDIFTYATLLMGFRHAKDLQSLLEIVFEMKSCCNLILDRSTFTAMVDALLYSGSIKAARVDYDIVKSPYRRMWPDSTGTISPEVQEEAGHLLMEAALNDGQALRNEGCYSHRGLIGVNEINVQPIPTSPVEEARPLPGTIALRKVVMRLFRDPVVPIVDDYCCTVKPAVRSIGHVIDLILAKRHKMVVVVKCGNLYGTGYSSTSRAVGFLTS